MNINDPILKRFRADLDAAYGNRVERAVLYGSRARGDARPDSDYDIAVFLKNFSDFDTEADRLATIETNILLQTGVIVNSMPFKADAYDESTGFMWTVRLEGRPL